MIRGLASMLWLVAGCVIGFAVTWGVTAQFPDIAPSRAVEVIIDWSAHNLGGSIWAFGACLALFSASTSALVSELRGIPSYREVAQLDQLTDIWIHLFVGIGVVWTAIGMRDALITTLDVPSSLTNDAQHVLARLVDGGILLALSTTIVGAIGGYLMRIYKSLVVGSELAHFYWTHEHRDREATRQVLEDIRSILSEQRSQPLTEQQYEIGQANNL